MRDEPAAASDDATHRQARLRISRQSRITHLLLHLKTARLLVGIRGDRFVNVSGHGDEVWCPEIVLGGLHVSTSKCIRPPRR